MTEADWKEVESQLALVVPTVYRLFCLRAASAGYDLAAQGLYGDTDSIVEGNLSLRLRLAGAEPKWEPQFLDVGLDDGNGGYYFLTTESPAANRVCLWRAHPCAIREVSAADAFFHQVMEELAGGFDGAAERGLVAHGPRFQRAGHIDSPRRSSKEI